MAEVSRKTEMEYSNPASRSNAKDDVQNFGYKQELKRTLTFKDLIVYGLVTMLPIAPIQVYGMIAQESDGMAPLVYLVGLLAMIFTALSYRQMSREFPIAGSVYNYVQRGLNPHIGFVTGWLIGADYLVIPALLTAFSASWLGGVFPSVPSYVWIVAFVLINTFISARGISLTARSNMVFLIMEMAVLIGFVIMAFKYVFINGQGVGTFSIAPIFQPDKINFEFIAKAASIAVLGFIGFDVISTLSEEVKNPTKTVGAATVVALLIIGFLFILQAYLAALAHPDHASLDPNMAFFDIAREVGGDFLYYSFIFIGVAAVGIANSLVVQSAISRILYSMSRDNVIPFSHFLGKIHPKYQTPFNATLLMGAVSLIVALAVPIDNLICLINFGALTSYMILNLTIAVYFFFKQKRRSGMDVVNYLLLPLSGFVIIGFVWWGLDTLTFYIGFGWMILGIILGAVKSKGYKEVPPVLRDI